MVGFLGSHLALLVMLFGKVFGFWKGLKVFNSFICFKFNNGDKVQFWKDPWCTGGLIQIVPAFLLYGGLQGWVYQRPYDQDMCFMLL